jgi:cytochrome c biogenesis protein CcmG/thiol:disulfide interchange protein DsbE
MPGTWVRYRATIWICILLLAGLLPGAYAAATGAPALSASVSLLNRKAPELRRMDLSGNILDLRSLRGKVVLLNFWATWCTPCQLEMPVFAQWQQHYGPQGLQIVGISMDDDAPPVRNVVTRLKLNYPIAMGDAKLGERYGGVLGLPLTYLIDRNGVVRARFEGETKLNKIEKQLKLVLAQP